ncbi:MAG TPA: hypothetical protein VLX91_16415 [Candidatus Acidoferrales bacterium]|nr:hypothetical protein [Candidatus Acidoferrales bacterium]
MIKMLKLFCAVSAVFIAAGCGSFFSGAGEDLGSGAMKPVNTYADSIGYNLVKGARTSLGDPRTTQVIDSLLSNIIDSTNAQLRILRDSLLGVQTDQRVAALRETLLGRVTREDLVELRNSVLDKNLQNYISEILNKFDNSVGEAGGSLRDSLLGTKSNSLVKAIIDTAMNDLQARLTYEVYPEMRANLSFVERNATWVIILIGAIALIIIGFIWRQKDKYLRMAKMLTYHISELPDEALRESLKTSISRNAKMVGIEGDLRDLLMKQGLLG